MNKTDPKKHDTSKHVCPACGETLPSDAPKGLCGGCLMAAALDPGLSEVTPATKATDPRVPDLEAVKAAFPQFEILELIGAGGMGAVYKARQPQLDRLVALKLLTVDAVDARFTQRFQQEAQTLARLSHPNIVTIHDYGEAGGFYYLLMEFMEGLNLRQLMGAERLAPKQALAIVPSICEALEYAHDHGVVHRDVKPENILMDKEGRVKIADFGIARLLGKPSHPSAKRASEATTKAGLTSDRVLGTPRYMAPEQSKTPEAVDHRADIYSLGVVLYEMLTGTRPDAADLTPPSERVDVDVRLDDVVLRALSQDPERRYQRASDFNTHLQTVATTEAPDNPPLPSSTTTPNRYATGRRHFITVASALLVLFTVVVYHSAMELIIMLFVGALVFTRLSGKPVPDWSAFSKTSRVCLAMAAVPAVIAIATLTIQLIPWNPSPPAELNELTPPETRRLNLPGHTVITVDDGLRTHYVFHFPGDITSVAGLSQTGGTSTKDTWTRDGTLALPSDLRIRYERHSENLTELRIDGKAWDLRNGALFQVAPNGSIVQRAIYPPLLREDNLREWIDSVDLSPEAARDVQ